MTPTGSGRALTLVDELCRASAAPDDADRVAGGS